MTTTPALDAPLTANDVIYMAEVINHMFATGRVRVLLDSGDILEGLLRHFCGKDLGPRVGEDVRGWYVRITTVGGLETALPLTELADKRQVGACALDPS
jgi:hypothetical protein